MSDAIEAAAKVIDPLAFAEQGSCPPRGWEHSTPKEVARLLERRKSHALSVAKRIIAAYRDSEIETLRAKLADGQAVIRHKGHDKICPALFCQRCFIARTSYEHWAFVGDAHDFEPGPCSESCGHDRTTGEKA